MKHLIIGAALTAIAVHAHGQDGRITPDPRHPGSYDIQFYEPFVPGSSLSGASPRERIRQQVLEENPVVQAQQRQLGADIDTRAQVIAAKRAILDLSTDSKLFPLQVEEVKKLFPLAFQDPAVLKLVENKQQANIHVDKVTSQPLMLATLLKDYPVKLSYGEVVLKEGAKLDVMEITKEGILRVRAGETKFLIHPDFVKIQKYDR